MMKNKNDKILVSVIIPIYNSQNYLVKCVTSLTMQTYENIEIILIDDGSYDGSSEICDQFSAKDKRIKVIHIRNSGVGSARNYGLKEAKGELVVFVDSDDYCKNLMIEFIVDTFLDTNADAVFGGYYTFFEADNTMKEYRPKETGYLDKRQAIKTILNNKSYGCFLCNKYFRKSILTDVDNNLLLFDEQYPIGEDMLWIVRVLDKCKSIYTFNEPYYIYNIHLGSACHAIDLNKKNFLHVKALEEIYSIISKVDSRLCKGVLVKLYDILRQLSIISYCRGDKELYKEIKRKITLIMKLYWIISSNVRIDTKCRQVVFDILSKLPINPQYVVNAYNWGVKNNFLILKETKKDEG